MVAYSHENNKDINKGLLTLWVFAEREPMRVGKIRFFLGKYITGVKQSKGIGYI